MYNTLRYSFYIWLSCWLAVPNIYLLYYLMNSGAGEHFPARAYTILVLTCLALSLPVGIAFKFSLDHICKTQWTNTAKKWAALLILQLFILLLFVLINSYLSNDIGGQTCFDFWVISSSTAAVCIWVYPLRIVGSGYKLK